LIISTLARIFQCAIAWFIQFIEGSFKNYVTFLGGRIICDSPNARNFFLWKICGKGGGEGGRKSRFYRDVICIRPLSQISSINVNMRSKQNESKYTCWIDCLYDLKLRSAQLFITSILGKVNECSKIALKLKIDLSRIKLIIEARLMD